MLLFKSYHSYIGLAIIFAQLAQPLAQSPEVTYPDATLYENEDKSGNFITFFGYLNAFSDVPSALQKYNLKAAALLCVKGVFVLYNKKDYQTTDTNDAMILVGSKDGTCVPPGQLGSLENPQSYNDINSESLTIFTGERLGGTGRYSVSRFEPPGSSVVKVLGPLKSLMLVGKGSWTVVAKSGKTFCLKSSIDSDFPICSVPYANKYIEDEHLDWETTYWGCNLTEASTITFNYCFNGGSGKLEPIGTEEVPGTTPSTPPETTDNSTEVGPSVNGSASLYQNCDSQEEFAMLTRIRMTQDFDNLYQVQFPFNKAYAWRTEILDNTISIITASYTDELIHRHVLHMIRELYIYFAEKLVWSKDKGWPSKRPTQRVLLIGYETNRCLMEMQSKNLLAITQKISEKILSDMDENKPGYKEGQIDKFFKRNRSFDTVMEFIWLSINLIGASCHAALGSETDFWMDYMNVAYDMYLHPMAEFWGKPGVVSEYYEAILGGYNIDRQFKGLAAATTVVYQAAQMGKLPRPEILQTTP